MSTIITSTTDFGKLVQQSRRLQKLTQAQLAGVCGVGIRLIVDLEKGKSTCQLGKALYVATMLGIEIKGSSSLEWQAK